MKSASRTVGEIIFATNESEADEAWRSASPETTVVLNGKVIGTKEQGDAATDEKLRLLHFRQRFSRK